MVGKVSYGKKFRTKTGKFGSYKYINGRRVAFIPARRKNGKKT